MDIFRGLHFSRMSQDGDLKLAGLSKLKLCAIRAEINSSRLYSGCYRTAAFLYAPFYYIYAFLNKHDYVKVNMITEVLSFTL